MLTRPTASRCDDATAFYESATGQRAASLLKRRLQAIMPNWRTRRVLGLGYTHPYLPENASFAISGRMNTPQTQRIIRQTTPFPDCLVDSGRLPFDDLSMDMVLVVHGLEFAPSKSDFIRAIWRVMTDDGVLALITPNRSGLWAHTDATPFGHGAPFSTRQLSRLLEQGMFRTECHTGALMTPPFILNHSSGALTERLGHTFGYPLAGVHVVLARKDAFAGLPVSTERLQPRHARPIAETA